MAKDFNSKSDYDKIAVLGASATTDLLSKSSQIVISSGDLASTYDPSRRRTRSNSNLSDVNEMELLETVSDLKKDKKNKKKKKSKKNDDDDDDDE